MARRRARLIALVAATGALVAALVSGAGSVLSGAQQAPPTFNRDIAPILFAKCVSCHRPGEIAPMSLLSYEAARPWARAIKTRVAAREMPPWPAAPPYGRFRNEHVLTDEQINTIVAWVDAGAPEGTGNPPRAPRLVEGWSSQMDRPPDMVIDAPGTFDLQANGLVPEFRIWAKAAFGRDRFIEALELRPTVRAAVHHASVFRARLPRDAAIGRGELWPGGPILEGVPVQRGGARAPLPVSPGQPLVFYVPAGGFMKFPSGVGKHLEPDDYLVWTFHLTTTGEPVTAGARLGLWFSRRSVEFEVMTSKVSERVLVKGQEIGSDRFGPLFPNIAPHDADYTVTGTLRITEPIILYALWPHMHYRGREMTFILEEGRGREQTLLSVPRYRSSWQFVYELARPMRIPAGRTIRAVARYDNSSRNPENPDPTQEVIWGPQAHNEMFDPFIEFAFDRPVMEQRSTDVREDPR